MKKKIQSYIDIIDIFDVKYVCGWRTQFIASVFGYKLVSFNRKLPHSNIQFVNNSRLLVLKTILGDYWSIG